MSGSDPAMFRREVSEKVRCVADEAFEARGCIRSRPVQEATADSFTVTCSRPVSDSTYDDHRPTASEETP